MVLDPFFVVKEARVDLFLIVLYIFFRTLTETKT